MPGLFLLGMLTVIPGVPASAQMVRGATSGASSGATSESAGPIVYGAVGGLIPVDQAAFTETESQLDRRLAAIRIFAWWDTPFPDATSVWARDTGRHVLLSVKAQTGLGFVRYADIAAARPGTPVHAAIVRWAQALKSFGAPIHFTFNHEPEAVASDGAGTAAEYVAAWRRVVTVFRAEGVTNAKYLFIATAHGYKRTDARRVSRFYPGDAYVDGLGADAYNWYNCRAGIANAWRPLADIISAFRQFGQAHPTKGMWLPEFASAEDPAAPDRKAQWVSEARELFKMPEYARFEGVLSFYRAVMRENCNFRVNSSTPALAAYRELAADPYYQGTLAP